VNEFCDTEQEYGVSLDESLHITLVIQDSTSSLDWVD
jgi:hypothetical protein